MKRSTNQLSLLCVASVLALAACASGDGAASDSANDSASAPTPSVATADSGTAANSGAPGALLDPNTATREQLMALPAMTAATVDSLVARRPFQNMLAVDSILSTSKLTEVQRDTIYERMFKPLDLNTASKQEIMLIPGVGEKMHHEFEEYRPYDNMAKFRREILKYVKDTTVTRYEKYVTIK